MFACLYLLASRAEHRLSSTLYYSMLSSTPYIEAYSIPSFPESILLKHLFLEAVVWGSRDSIRSNDVPSREQETSCGLLIDCMQGTTVNFSTKDIKCCSAHVVIRGLIASMYM